MNLLYPLSQSITTVMKVVALVLLLVLFVPPAVAQQANSSGDESSDDSGESSTPEYEEGIGHGEDKDVGYGAETSFLTWHGYLNFEYDNAQGKNSNFDNHEFYLSTHATLSRRLGLTAEFEYEHAPEKLILPIQAYADYKLAKWATFRAGIFFTPIGISRSYNLRGNKNRMIRQVGVTHDLVFENWSEVGINFFGEFKNGLFYDVAIGNGMNNVIGKGDSWFDADGTLQSHSEDNNDNKALHSRFGYHARRFLGGELNVGASFATQKYDPEGVKELTHKALDLRFLHSSGFRVQAEFMIRSGDDNEPDLERGISANAEGWYFQASRRFVFEGKRWLNYIEPVVQVDYIDNNVNTDTNGDKLTTALGFIFSPEPFYLIKFEYDFVQEVHGESVDNNKLWLAVVLEF